MVGVRPVDRTEDVELDLMLLEEASGFENPVKRAATLPVVARTAVIAGTATITSRAISKRMQQKGMQKEAQQEQQVQAAPAPTGITPEQKLAQLKELAELKQMGALTEEEFQQEKQKIPAQ